MKRFFLFLMSIPFILISCEKDKNILGTDWDEGVIYYTGAPEVDGCGWLLFKDGESYHLENIPVGFEVEGLDVWFKGQELNETYSCGLGQTQYSTYEFEELIEKPWQVRHLSDYPLRETSYDMFSIDSSYVDGDSLRLHVGYSGGCAIHQFNFWALETGGNGEGALHLMLEHIGNGDICEAYLKEWLAFSLVPIREQGEHEVKFWLRGSPIMSMMFGEFTYAY